MTRTADTPQATPAVSRDPAGSSSLLPAASSAPPDTSPAPSAALAPGDGWSSPDQGVRGRLVLTPVPVPGGRPQLRIEVELENVSGGGPARKLAWGTLDTMLKFSLEDDAGHELPQNGVGGNHFEPPPTWLLLPARGSVRFPVSATAYKPHTSGAPMLWPVGFQAWDMPAARTTPLYLRARLLPLPSGRRGDVLASPEAKATNLEWSGTLSLPRVALP